MRSSSEPRRTTQPLTNTQPLAHTTRKLADEPISSTISQLRPPNLPVTTGRVPIVIPAFEKRQRHAPQPPPPRRRRPILVLGLLLGSVVMLIATALFVIPLDNGQPPINGLQAFGNWITTGQFGVINPSQHTNPPTPTPALLTGEGYCGGSDIWGTCATAITASSVMGTGQLQRPVLGATITQYFGHSEYQFWCGCWKPHSGIDLAAPYGAPIMAADSGQVIWTGWDWSGLGWAVKINHGHYLATIYGHLERFTVKVGENVTQGQVIGYEGSTGASSGPHVHFMVLYNNVWVNPLDYVQLP